MLYLDLERHNMLVGFFAIESISSLCKFNIANSVDFPDWKLNSFSDINLCLSRKTTICVEKTSSNILLIVVKLILSCNYLHEVFWVIFINWSNKQIF